MKARKINAAIWAVVAVVISTMVCVEWHSQGCEWWQLAVAIAFYAAGCLGIWGVIDQTIKDIKE